MLRCIFLSTKAKMNLATLYVSIAAIVSMMSPSTGVPLAPLPVDYLRLGLAASDPPYDENGCCVSCGYTYCSTLGQCVRAWETPCPALINPFGPEPLASINAYPVYEVPEPEEVQLQMPKI